MATAEEQGIFGLRDPLTAVPKLTALTLRRTMNVDVGPANDWFGGGDLEIHGSAPRRRAAAHPTGRRLSPQEA